MTQGGKAVAKYDVKQVLKDFESLLKIGMLRERKFLRQKYVHCTETEA